MMPAQQYYAAGSNGNHAQQPVAEVNPPAEITQLAEDFCRRYPVDANAMDYLLTSTPEVQARVVQEFRPPREGEGDYSALLTAFVKRCRGDARSQGGPLPPPQQAHPAAAAGSPLLPGGTIVGAGGQLLTLSPAGVYVEVQPEAMGQMAGGWGAQQDASFAGNGMPMPPDQPLPGTLDSFLLRYPVDERAIDYFTCQRQEVQEKVLRDFRPPREGDNDYSSLFMSFVKRCRADSRYSGAGPPPSTGPAPGPPAQRTLVYATPAPLLAAGGGAAAYVGGGFAPDQGLAQAQAGAGGGLDALAARYPIDDRAYDYFSTCSPEVQDRIVREFRPPREGEADYSSLFMSFVKRCRQGAPRQDAYLTPFAQAPQMQPMQQGTAPGGGGCGGIGAMLSSGPEGLEAFRLRFPVDERALAYLAESSEEVRERVLNTFVPPRPDDMDFSAPVTAYVRECRRLLDPGSLGLPAAAPQQQQQHMPQMQMQPQPAADAAGAFAGADGVGDELNSFLQRYPVDARALDYLSTSSPGVLSRVIREFAPKQEGDSDYSPLVMAFTKRLRGEERTGVMSMPGGFLEPPWKRPRAY